MIPLLHLHWICDAEKKHILTSFIHVLRGVYDSWHLLSPNAFIKFASYALRKHNSGFDVCGSLHHSIIHKENPTRCNSVSKFYFLFIWSSTCFRRHTAHHQEPKTAVATNGFVYVEGCWTFTCWTLSASSNYTSNNPPPMQNQRLLMLF